MKKPWFIRLFGWLFWCGVVWIGFVMLCLLSRSEAGVLFFGIGLYASLTGFCLVVWLIGSLVAWHAQQKNSPIEGANRRQAAAPTLTPPQPPVPQPPAPQGPLCHVCRTANPVWRCATHGLMLCAQCRPHYQCPPTSYDCHWQPVQASLPQAVMTSPLGGLR